jgi:hypothetical protein
MKIEEIEKAIAALDPDDFEALRLWFAGFVGESVRREAAAGRVPRRRRDREERQVCEQAAGPGIRHSRTDHFRICCRQLPAAVRSLVDDAFELLDKDSTDPSLQFQRDGLIWSMNIGTGHKALALDANGRFLWYWVGSCEQCYSAATG